MVKSKSMVYMQCTGCCEWRHKTKDKYFKKIFKKIAPEVETKAKVFSEISASCSQAWVAYKQFINKFVVQR